MIYIKMLSHIYESPWTTIFLLIVVSTCLNSVIGTLRGQ